MPLIIVISGPSAGVGKGTIIKALLKRDKNLYLAKSVTTRPKREDEAAGVEYYFRSEEEFEGLLKKEAFFEWVEFLGHRYGSLKSEIEEPLRRGQDVILEVDVRGAKILRERNLPHTVYIFIKPPSFADLRKRLKKRDTESKAEQEKRLEIARQELLADYYDYYVVNEEGKHKETVEKIEKIIDKKRQKR